MPFPFDQWLVIIFSMFPLCYLAYEICLALFAERICLLKLALALACKGLFDLLLLTGCS